MYRLIKRCFDFLSSFILLLIISPFFLILILLVRIKLGTPVFFLQERTGMHLKRFNIIKFRTMTNDTDNNGNLLPDEQRSVPFGKFLRSSSLDELPELLNIIKGDMSVIGPRSLPPLYDEFYYENEKDRFLVRGGLIPPDSVEKSPYISWKKQLDIEADYGKNLSFKKDWTVFMSIFQMLYNRDKTDYGEYVRQPLNVERANMKQNV